MGASQQEIAYTSIPPRQKERLDFLMGLYPNGKEKSEIIKKIMNVYNYTEQNATNLANGMLKEFSEEAKVITIVPHRDGKYIVGLTKKGVEEIMKYLSAMRKDNVQQFFAVIKKWIEKGSKDAKQRYKIEAMKLFLERPSIVCMMVIPHFENDIINQYVKITGKEPTPQLKGEIIDFIGSLVNARFVSAKTKSIEGNSETAYYLRKEGLVALDIMFKFLREQLEGKRQETGATISTGKKKYYDKLWFKIWLAAIITGFLSTSASMNGKNVDFGVLGGMIGGMLIMVMMVIVVSILIPLLARQFKKA